MIKKNLKALIISSIVILLPMVVGLLLWDQLPERFVSHWGIDGQPDGWAGKPMAVFGMPLFILAVQWIGALVTAADPKNKNQTNKAFTVVLWITPAISLLGAGMIYGTALGMVIQVNTLMPIFMGILFLFVGNYLPKCKQNHTIGLKLPWTLDNEENWNATHRLGGKVWVAAGVLMLLCTFLPESWNVVGVFVVTVAAVVIPCVYSYVYYRKQAEK